jgi:hypothetical protein
MTMWPTTDRQPTVSLLTTAAWTMARVLLTVLAVWTGLAVSTALFVAALGRSALRED